MSAGRVRAFLLGDHKDRGAHANGYEPKRSAEREAFRFGQQPLQEETSESSLDGEDRDEHKPLFTLTLTRSRTRDSALRLREHEQVGYTGGYVRLGERPLLITALLFCAQSELFLARKIGHRGQVCQRCFVTLPLSHATEAWRLSWTPARGAPACRALR